MTAAAEPETLRARVAQLEREEARRRNAERELQESEDRFRVLVETMNDGVGVQDERGNIVYINDKLAQLLGCSRQELAGRPVIDIVDESQHDLFRREVARRVLGERTPYELVLACRDGRKILTFVSPVPILGPDGTFKGSFAVVTDITSRRQAEEALAAERNLLRTLMNSIPDYAFVKDRESRFVTTNTAHLKALGVASVAEVVGKTDFDFFPRDAAEQYYANEQVVMESGQPLLSKVEQVVYRDGEVLWVMTFKAPLRDSAGQVVGLVGVSRDITPFRNAEQALRETEDRFRLILENSRDVAYKLNLTTRQLEYVSPSVVEVAGYTAQEVMAQGTTWRYLEQVHPEDRKRVVAHFRDLRSHGGKDVPTVIEYRGRRKDGQYRWVAQNVTILYGDDGTVLAEVGTIRDISASRNAEEALRAASRMEATATLAGGIAHDFNNLMVGVLGNAELVQMRLKDDPDAMRMLGTIAKSAQQAGELAQQMLAFARGGKYEPQVINLDTVIEEALRLEERSFPPRIRLEQRTDANLWNIKADPSQMGQIVTTLSINAVEAIEDTGRIMISTHNVEVDEAFAKSHPGLHAGRYVCLMVEDTGHGMSPEVVARVFEPFFTTKFQGRGLGLAAVYGIVKNHAGHIVVRSQVGQGTLFEVYLPAVEEPGEKAAKAGPAALEGNETILVIDDEPVVLDVMKEILERFGYRVLCARDGREAVELARSFEGEIHLAVLDMGMPVMGGAQAYSHLKKVRPKLKVIIASGYELDAAAQALLNAGASAFVHKPFRVNQLVSKVRGTLDDLF